MRDDKCICIPRKLFDKLFIEGYRIKECEDRLLEMDKRTLDMMLDSRVIEFKDQDDVINVPTHVRLIVKHVIKDFYDTGMYLCIEDDKDKITIPGGHLSDINFSTKYHAEDIFKDNLIREMSEEYDQSQLYYISNKTVNSDLMDRLKELGVYASSINDKMYYLYKPDITNTLTVFVVTTVTKVSNFIDKRSVFVDRKEYLQGRAKPTGNYINDIRFNQYSYYLDDIFNTREIF